MKVTKEQALEIVHELSMEVPEHIEGCEKDFEKLESYIEQTQQTPQQTAWDDLSSLFNEYIEKTKASPDQIENAERNADMTALTAAIFGKYKFSASATTPTIQRSIDTRMKYIGMIADTLQTVRQERGAESGCETGCKKFSGGEIKHNEHCKYYPDSLTKYYADLEQKNAALQKRLDELVYGLPTADEFAELFDEPEQHPKAETINAIYTFLESVKQEGGEDEN